MFRLIAFTATFFLGLWSGTILHKLEVASASSYFSSSGSVADAEPTVHDENTDITLAGWDHGDNNHYPSLRFVVHNGTSERLYFSGYSSDDPWPLIKVGDKKLWYYWCGTGVGRHFIESGHSMTFNIQGHVFREHRESKARFTVGIELSTGEKGDDKLIETIAFALPAEFIKELTLKEH